MNLRVRLEVLFPDLDCKTVGFFLTISKEIGKAWRKSLTPAKCASLSLSLSVFILVPVTFQTFCLAARAYLNTQKYGLFCSLLTLRFKSSQSHLILTYELRCFIPWLSVLSFCSGNTRTGFGAEGDLVPPFFTHFLYEIG